MPSLIIKTGGTYTMSGKYMKIKRVILPTITMVIIASQLFGCASTTKQEAYDMMRETEQIELEYAVPDYDSNAEESKVELLPWLQLSSLETHPELRTAFEEYVGVTGTTGNKEGTLYYNPKTQEADQNVTLYMATKNSAISGYFANIDAMTKFGEIATENYTDIDVDDVNAPYATINAYFELLPDQEDGQFDGDSTISRAQAMALLMRATTPVNESQAPETDSDFTAKVGESQYTNFAAPMNQYAYLNTSNGLTDKTFNTTMSRGEYIYLLTNYIYGDTYAQRMEEAGKEDETLSDDLSLTNIKDGGNITFQEALNNPENGLPTEMYKTLARAVALGFVTEDTLNWDEAITKSEAINLFIDAVEISYGNAMFVTNKDGTPEATNSEGLTVDEAIDADNDYLDSVLEGIEGNGDEFTKLDAWAKSQGADAYDGAWLIYYYGSAAGDQRSYAINQRTGEKMVAGPDSFFYGTSLDDDGAEPFWGTDKTYPGDKYPEFEQNMRLATGFDVD